MSHDPTKAKQVGTVRRISSFVRDGSTRYCLSFTLDRTVYPVCSEKPGDIKTLREISQIRDFDEIEFYFRNGQAGDIEVVFIKTIW